MIKKGDNVIVITGSNKGKKGTVVKVFPKLNANKTANNK